MRMIGGSTSGRRRCGVSIESGAPKQRLHFRKKTTLAQEMLAGLQQLLPAGFQVYVLFDSWYAANRLLKFCRRQGWHVVCAIKSNRKLDNKQLSQWPQALRHQRYQRVQLTATDGRQRPYLVRPLPRRLNHLSFDVCVLISKRHHRDTHPKYFLCTDLVVVSTRNPQHLSKALAR